MRCKNVRELAGSYIYGDLTPEEMKAVRLHAQHCPHCSEEIRAQMTVVSGLSNAAPTLTDEDRQRIAWTVKGAVKAVEPERRRHWFGFSPAYGLAAAVVIGMVAIKVMSSMSPSDPPQSGAEKATVVVTEVVTPKAANKDKVADTPAREGRGSGNQTMAQTPEDPKPQGSRSGEGYRVIDGLDRMRAALPLGAYTNRHRKPVPPAVVPPEPPAPVMDPADAPDVRMDTGDNKLPNPTDVNDAQTTPPDTTEKNGTVSSDKESLPGQ